MARLYNQATLSHQVHSNVITNDEKKYEVVCHIIRYEKIFCQIIITVILSARQEFRIHSEGFLCFVLIFVRCQNGHGQPLSEAMPL